MRRCGGFTLIELLLALFLFAVALAAISGVLQGALRLRNNTTRMFERSLPVQQAIATLRRDFSGMVLPGGTLAGDFRTGSATLPGMNTQMGLEIFTSSGLPRPYAPWGDIQKVGYTLRDPVIRGATPARDLVRLVSRNLLANMQEQPEEQIVLNGVERMEFSFYNGSQWLTSWDSTTEETKVPKAVRIELTMADQDAWETGRSSSSRNNQKPIQLIVPVYVTASTNQTETADSAEGEAL